MKYLVNRKTKEHKVLHRHTEYATCDWQVVEADSEGWIAYTGKECPLPDKEMVEIMDISGDIHTDRMAQYWGWGKETAFYRPKGKPQMEKMGKDTWPTPQYDPRSVSFNLIDRLKAAHAQAQTIPDLEAELREVLGGMGYDLVARSPFVETEAAVEPDMSDWRNWREGDELVARNPFVEAESGHKFEVTMATGPKIFDAKESVLYQEGFHAPQDMSDWRNWREGDALEVVQQGAWTLTEGSIVIATAITERGDVLIDSSGYKYRHSVFRFLSRPKGE